MLDEVGLNNCCGEWGAREVRHEPQETATVPIRGLNIFTNEVLTAFSAIFTNMELHDDEAYGGRGGGKRTV